MIEIFKIVHSDGREWTEDELELLAAKFDDDDNSRYSCPPYFERMLIDSFGDPFLLDTDMNVWFVGDDDLKVKLDEKMGSCS